MMIPHVDNMEFCISGKKVSTETDRPNVKTGERDNELQTGNCKPGTANRESGRPGAGRNGRTCADSQGLANSRGFVNHLDWSHLTDLCQID